MTNDKEDEKAEEGEGRGSECLCSNLWAFTIRGYAFLWHQVRCMVAVLFLVGAELESPDIISRLLDIEETPRKPSYEMASELPLLLYKCSFPQLDWILPEASERERVRERVRSEMERSLMECAIHFEMGRGIEKEWEEDARREKQRGEGEKGIEKVCEKRKEKVRKYIPLLERAVEPSVEERVDRLPSRKRKRYDERFGGKEKDGKGEGEAREKEEEGVE